MVKRVFRFPICSMLLALLCVSIPALADNIDLASAQPGFDRPLALSFSGFNNNSQLSLARPENVVADGRFVSELCSFGCVFQPSTGRSISSEISWLKLYQSGDYPDFGKDRGYGDFFWKKHPPRSVPEPSSLTFLGTSVLVVAFSLRRRFQR